MSDSEYNFMSEAIIKNIAFFDMFDFPLVAIEILEGLNLKSDLGEVIGVLDDMAGRDGRIGTKDGFYFLAGRSDIVETRLKRYNTSSRKFRRALLTARIFRLVPWIRLIAVGNLLGADNFRGEADIDFFIVAEKGRIWVTRFFTVVIVKLLGLRASEERKRDRICLSFFVSEDALDLSGLMLPLGSGEPVLANQPAGKDDPYFAHWLSNLNIIYEQEDWAVDGFWQANGWLCAVLPNWSPIIRLQTGVIRGGFGKLYGKIMDFLFGWLEGYLERLQMARLAPKLRELVNLDTRVRMDDSVLKLHDNDRRGEFREKLSEPLIITD
jgi:hypothetical protein